MEKLYRTQLKKVLSTYTKEELRQALADVTDRALNKDNKYRKIVVEEIKIRLKELSIL